jgi:hypothetical protein
VDVTVLPVSCPLWSARYPIYYLPSCTYRPWNVYPSLTSYLHTCWPYLHQNR